METESKPRRIETAFPKGFNPDDSTMVKKVEAKLKAGGYRLVGIDRADQKLHAELISVVDVSEVTTTASGKQVTLPAQWRSPSQGDKAAAKLEEQHPGWVMVKFDPHVGNALLMRLTEDEIRARGAIAHALGFKPWDVTISARKDGGFNFKLPSYTPSKHNPKLKEVVETAIGKFGWYFTMDGKTLQGSIIPSTPPTFPASIEFPFNKLRPVERWDSKGDKERFSFLLAQELGEPGQNNVPLIMSMEDDNAALIVGLPGSGKALAEDCRVPVPASDKFPDGWAENSQLDVGDILYSGATGQPVPIRRFSAWKTETLYRVSTDTGVDVTVTASHLWKIMDPALPRRVDDQMAEKLGGLIGLWSGSAATLDMIGRLSGIDVELVREAVGPLQINGHYPIDEVLHFARNIYSGGVPWRIVTTEHLAASGGQWWQLTGLPGIEGEEVELVNSPATYGYLMGVADMEGGVFEPPAGLLRGAGWQREQFASTVVQQLGGTWTAQGGKVTLRCAANADLLVEVVRSLGGKARVAATGNATFRVRFHFGLPAHITGVEKVGVGRSRCIMVDDVDHTFLVEGFIPTHNSVTIQSLVVQALVKGFRLAIINTPAKQADYQWAKPYVEDNWWGCSDEGTSCAEALTVASLVKEEGRRLAQLTQQYGVHKWQDLPEEVKAANPPILVVADELASLLNKPNLPSGLSKEAKELPQFVAMAQAYLEAKLLTVELNELVAVYRAAGVREWYITQRPSKTEGFPAELKNLMSHRVRLGTSPSQSDDVMAFRDARRIPPVPSNIADDGLVSRGVGVAHLNGSDPVIFKGFYASSEAFMAVLRKYRGEGDASDVRVRPTAAQIDKYVPKAVADNDDDDDGGGLRSPVSGKSARSIAEKMGDVEALAMADSGLKGFAKANAARHAAAGGGKTRSQREQEKEEARAAALSSEVSVTKMRTCDGCGGWVNPVTKVCLTCKTPQP